MTQHLETAIAVYLYIDEDRVDGSFVSHPNRRGSTHLSFTNFTGSLKLSYMARIGDVIFPAGLPEPPEVVNAVFPAGLLQPLEVVTASLPMPRVINLLTPQAPRARIHDPSMLTSRGCIDVKPNGEEKKIKIEGSRNKRKRSDKPGESKVNAEQSNSPPRKIRALPGGNRKLG
jgi:hypothetical protein